MLPALALQLSAAPHPDREEPAGGPNRLATACAALTHDVRQAEDLLSRALVAAQGGCPRWPCTTSPAA